VIAIVDYDMGNVASVANMLKRVGVAAPVLTRDPDVLARADKLILPGVGAFDLGMRNLSSLGLIDPIKTAVSEKNVPMLGICLGMQLLTCSSEEGTERGLGWIQGSAKRFRPTATLKVPHMGWNEVRATRDSELLLTGSPSRYYFVHSYYVECDSEDSVLATTEYGHEFASIIARDNVFGVQFHPEKSHRYGMALLKSFVEL
jgi:glutamine amidotransferase